MKAGRRPDAVTPIVTARQPFPRYHALVRHAYLLGLFLLTGTAGYGCQGDLDTGNGGNGGNGANGAAGASTGANGGAGGQGGMSTVGSGTLILAGTVVTPDQSFEGEVQIDADLIVCVGEGTTCSDAAPAADVIVTGGVIAPGLIDTHNHILFDIFDDDDWVPNLPASCGTVADCEAGTSYCNNNKCACVAGTCKYTNHSQWPNEVEYGYMLDYKQCLEDASQGKPIWCPLTYDGDGDLKCEMDKWGEMKGIVAGTTSIVGLPGNSSKCFGSVARSIDVPQNDLDADKVQTSALFPPNSSSASGVCQNFTDGDTDAYLIHVGEGTNSAALDEFAELFTVSSPEGCLYAPQTTITHGTSFTPAQFSQMAAAGMKLTWSPASNIALYGTTTDIPAALDAGVLVALAPDWSMGGSQNLLDELRTADDWDDDNWNDRITPKMLIEMVTSNAAAVLGLADTIGRLEVGFKADIAVFTTLDADPFRSITLATPADVRLVMVDGIILFSDPDVQEIEPSLNECETISVCGTEKLLCVGEPGEQDLLDQTYTEIQTALDAGLDDLDAIAALAPSACNNSCGIGESCYERTVHEIVAESNCPSACLGDEACFHVAMSGNNQFDCRTINACSPTKFKNLAPVAPLVSCQ